MSERSAAQQQWSRGVAGLTAAERTVPLIPAFAALIPECRLRRGSVVACTGDGDVTLAVSVIAGASQDGAWVGIAGAPTIGCRAMAELGVDLGRVVLVAEPAGGFAGGQWGDVLAAMIDGFDVVLLGDRAPALTPAAARKLQARLQSRGVVLVLAGSQGAFVADVQITGSHGRWLGLGAGHGVAVQRQLHVAVHGRRVARPQRRTVLAPGLDGCLEVPELIELDQLGPDLVPTVAAGGGLAPTG